MLTRSQALVLYQAAVIYSRTSMFPGQSRIPIANQQAVRADTERRINLIFTVAGQHIQAGQQDNRSTIFAVFIAGIATSFPDAKVHAIDLIKAFEGTGIGQNTYRTRQLLVAVCEEQRRHLVVGGNMEGVDWLVFARERGLTVVNCGL